MSPADLPGPPGGSHVSASEAGGGH
eukprot:COSAG01_NODE_72485_length_253_cov_0.337662_1_plen_24_part_01